MTTWTPSRRTPHTPAETPSAPTASLVGVRGALASPVAPYYLVLGATFALCLLGLVMVLSASSVRSLMAGEAFWSVGVTQAMYAGVGILGLLLASRIPIPVWRRLAPAAFVLAVLLQLAVIGPLGVTVQGNRNWLELGPVRMQPSEFGKLALVLLGAALMARKRKVIGRVMHALVPYVVPLAGGYVGLVLLGHDLGTGLVLLAIVGAVLFAAGVQARWFVLAGAAVGAGIGFLVMQDPSRMARVDALVGGCADASTQAACFQRVHAQYALADGGWWGVGLGASREKWGILPEPHNDFIFAIIGEELGMPGTITVLGLFVVLAYACYRIAAESEDFFVRVGTVGIMVWVLGQAIINIGSVTGLLPIIGVPLPLVSSGGSALLATLVAMGVLLAFARSLPGAGDRLAGRRVRLRASLALRPRLRGR